MIMPKSNLTSKSRRQFIFKSTVGLSILMGFGWTACAPIRRKAAQQINDTILTFDAKFPPLVWFEINHQNEIILHSPKVEMGQGIFTGLAQLAAEELEVDLEQIKVVHASTQGRPVDPRGTGNSDSLASLWEPLREISAKLRYMLVQNAADILKVPAESLQVQKGKVFKDSISLTYGEIIKQAPEWKVPKSVQLKNPTQFKVIGKSLARVDLAPKVLGEPIYGFDATLPNMLYASVLQPTQLDSTFIRADIESARDMPGVVAIIVEKDFVGVVAKSHLAAEKAKQAIQIEWKVNKVWEQADIDRMIEVGKGKSYTIQKIGKAEKFLTEKVLSQTYSSPIGAHAQLEPSAALADVNEQKATIILSTQVAKITQDEVADRLGIDPSKVEIKTTFLGGGFGRRLHTPHAVQAAVLSKAVAQPVKLFYTRKEEFQQDTFRPPTKHLLRAKLSTQGKIEALEHQVSSGTVAFGSPLIPGVLETFLGADFGAWRGGLLMYNGIPNLKTVSWKVDLPFGTSWWRGLGLWANTFAIESFMDELATQAGRDPVQFRLDHLKEDAQSARLKQVIQAAAKGANWDQTLPSGRARGIAASIDMRTPVAQVVELSISERAIKIHKVTCAIDPGIVVNPDSVKAQCEGAINMGLSAALYEEMTIKNGSLQATIYGDYKMALLKDAPEDIEVILLESGGSPSGVGEPPIGPIAAATTNAVFALTGKRLRNLPLSI